MAETPDLGAAEESFTATEATFKEAETSYLAAQEAWQADESNEELKTAFTEQETAYNEVKATYDTAKTSLDELKANSKQGYWPEDWKETYVDKQVDKDGKPLTDDAKEKLSKRLARYASPQAALDAMINAQNKISAGGMVKVPGKDATPEEIAQYRAEIGVPEDAKGYDLTLDNGLVIGEEDKPMIDEFLAAAHESNYNQQQVKDGLNWYYKTQEDAIAKRFEADTAQKSEAEEELRAEWGPEYKANVNLMANYLGTDFSEGTAELITGARLADGTPLANHPEILRGFVAKARAENPMGALVPGTGTKQHDQMVTEIEALEKKMGEGSLKGKDQDRYLKLVSMRDKVPEK